MPIVQIQRKGAYLSQAEHRPAAAKSTAMYEKIKRYVSEHNGLNVSTLYITQVKQKYGIITGINFVIHIVRLLNGMKVIFERKFPILSNF